jgi:hypothetical protein
VYRLCGEVLVTGLGEFARALIKGSLLKRALDVRLSDGVVMSGGIEAGAAEHLLPSVDRFKAGHGVALELFDLVEVFEAYNGKGSGAEAVFDPVARPRFCTWA